MTAEPASLADRFCDTVDRINSRVGRFFALSILVVVIAVLYEVFARGMFGQATLWANETTIYLSAVAYVIGGGYEAVFRLNCPAGPVELRENYSFLSGDVAGIAASLATHVEKLCNEWERIHGSA